MTEWKEELRKAGKAIGGGKEDIQKWKNTRESEEANRDKWKANCEDTSQNYQLNSACFLLICSKCCSNATTEFVLVVDEYFFPLFLGGNGCSFWVEKLVWKILPFTSSLRSARSLACKCVNSKMFYKALHHICFLHYIYVDIFATFNLQKAFHQKSFLPKIQQEYKYHCWTMKPFILLV